MYIYYYSFGSVGDSRETTNCFENYQIKKIVVKDVLYAQRFLTSIHSGGDRINEGILSWSPNIKNV